VNNLLTTGHADQIACPVETAKLNSKERYILKQQRVTALEGTEYRIKYIDSSHSIKRNPLLRIK